MRHLPHGRYLSIAVLLLVVVYCNCNLAEALDSEEQQRGTGDELTHAVRKVSWSPGNFKNNSSHVRLIQGATSPGEPGLG